ncbi:uncharacterized protein KGF55_005624 [Candida pseudojiufengensis]|uniref:uncharacterized protein n=1 Tax=Candida pseudojiufengensis TaxID=497109 RepID=UPI002224B89B|nr:uncharacterized protein KGF55_005624 [Candida pseudojiufengensis]KAI5958970.1 hypothetical protein KGF55_005624 [Candida pseudojiufengensis]
MEIFLKLPEELWMLIINYIDYQPTLEELVLIPTLQKYALQERFSNFILGSSDTSDGSMKDLQRLYEVYNFKPSRIVIEATKLSELLGLQASTTESEETGNFEAEAMNLYGHAKFEILITDGMHVDLKSILKNVNVVGVHLSESEPFGISEDGAIEFQAYLQAIQTSKIEFMTAIYANYFAFKFPTSLKRLKLDTMIVEIAINLSDLQCLEYFECSDLIGVKSLDDLRLTRTIRSIKLCGCEFETLGNLDEYVKLRSIEVNDFSYLFEIFKSTFPESLERLTLCPSFDESNIRDLFTSAIEGTNEYFVFPDFSDDGTLLRIGFNFKLTSNLKVLKIHDYYKTSLEVGFNSCFVTLSSLDLCGIKIKLIELFSSIPVFMEKVKIIRCEVTDVYRKPQYPIVRQLYFSDNLVFNTFQINFKEMVNLNQLEIKNNFLYVSDTEENNLELDPCRFLIGEFDALDETSEFLNKKRKISKESETLQIDVSNITSLVLGKSDLNTSTVPGVDHSNCIPQLPSQICIKGCTILKTLHLSGLGIQILDLHKFPISLKDISISNLKLFQIKGEFSLLNQLTQLWSINNGITHSMLLHQRFPSSLERLYLCNDKIEDLTCLKIDNCDKLHILMLLEVTGSLKPKGANVLKTTFVELNGNASSSYGVATTYDSEEVFLVVDGVDKNQNTL